MWENIFFSWLGRGASQGTPFYYLRREGLTYSHTDERIMLKHYYSRIIHSIFLHSGCVSLYILYFTRKDPFWNLLYAPLYREWSSECFLSCISILSILCVSILYFTRKNPFWNLLYAPLYRAWSSEWGQSVFPNMTPCLPPPLKQLYFLLYLYLYLSVVFHNVYIAFLKDWLGKNCKCCYSDLVAKIYFEKDIWRVSYNWNIFWERYCQTWFQTSVWVYLPEELSESWKLVVGRTIRNTFLKHEIQNVRNTKYNLS